MPESCICKIYVLSLPKELSAAMSQVTIRDIANELTLSVSTISRALNGDSQVHAETRRKVVEAADRMGYRRNPLAVNLRRGYSGIVGVIVHDMLTPLTSRILLGVQHVMHKQNINVIIANSNNDSETERRNLAMMEQSRVDGIIASITDWETNGSLFSKLDSEGTPVVYCHHRPLDDTTAHVCTDDFSYAFQLVNHLLSSGRKRIAFLSGTPAVANFPDEARAYMEALRGAGLEPDCSLMVPVDISAEGGVKAADTLLDNDVEFDAVFSSSELPAIGMMNRLRERGRSIPDDVAVAAMGGSPLSEIVYPPLTTAEPPLVEMGEEAARLLLERIRERTPAKQRCLAADIRLRRSSESSR